MYDLHGRTHSPAAPPTPQQQPETPLLGQRQHSSPLCGGTTTTQRSSIHTTAVPATSSSAGRPLSTPLWNRQSASTPPQTHFHDSLGNIPAPLLLSRSIRETTLHRVEGGLSRTASNYAQSGDDTDDGRSAVSPVEMPELMARESSMTGALTTSARHGAGSHPRLTSPSSSSPVLGTDACAMTNFESLWSNIDRYLFAVYTTLQTGDESSLRPLRTPKHRMGWYTVIYNACSGDPAKSRELYARLALLLLHLLESHVLFPILQNVDHSRIQFLTGAEESAADDGVSSNSLRHGNSGASQSQQQQQQQQQQTSTHSSSGSFRGWGKFKSIATGGATSFGGPSRTARSKDVSRNSSFRGSTGHVSNTSNTSFGFMRRLFQSSHGHHGNQNNATTSPLTGMDADENNNNNNSSQSMSNVVNEDNGSIGGLGRRSSTPSVPGTSAATALLRNNSHGRVGWSSTSGPSTPLQQLQGRTSSDAANAFMLRQASSSAAGDINTGELRSAFEGFDSTVRRNSGSPPPPRATTAAVTSSAAPQRNRGGLTIRTRVSPSTPMRGSLPRTPPLNSGATTPPLPQPFTLSRQSTAQTVTLTASGSASSSLTQSPTLDPHHVPSTAPPSAISSHHARVASKTGRVLVNDEEEVLCEANTVNSRLRNSKRNRRQQPHVAPHPHSHSHAHPQQQQQQQPSSFHAAQHKNRDGELLPSHSQTFDNSSKSPHRRTHTVLSDEVDDGSLHTMNSSLTSRHLSGADNDDDDEDRNEDGDMSTLLTGGSATVVRRDRRRGGNGAAAAAGGGGAGASVVRGRRALPQLHGASAFPDDATEDSTAVPSANFVSPSSASLSSGEADIDSTDLDDDDGATPPPREVDDSAFFSPQASSAVYSSSVAATADGGREESSALTVDRSHKLPSVFHDSDAPSPLLLKTDEAPTSVTSVPATNYTNRFSDPTSLSRQASSSGPGSSYTGRETAVPVSPSTPPLHASATSTHESPLYDSTRCTGETTAAAADHAGAGVHGGRRFSLCYTFIQEWQTFLIFRGVVLSCFRYLDQYYTRRYGMDTITLMCFKVFYVTVYEPLHPLIVLELRYLTRYVREVYEITGQVAWEQLELIQATYNIMAELLVLVQSTSSYMVAQQQQQQQQQQKGSVSGGGVSNATVTNTTSSASPVVEPVRSRTSSRARSIGGGGPTNATGVDSSASSVVSTPRMGALDLQGGTLAAAASAADKAGNATQKNRRRGLLAFFNPKRHSESAVAKDEARAAVAPAASCSGETGEPTARAAVAGRTSARLSSPSPASPAGDAEPSAASRNVLSDPDDWAGLENSQSNQWTAAPGGSAFNSAAPSMAVVVDLRGTVELRDRLEGHTTAHHLTTQALKQWEGLAADRRLRSGTIVKETAQALATIVMEDMGNDYVAGIYAFYRVASASHRDSDEGRRFYVQWALGVKELEMQVWGRVQLPFLHTAIQTALNESLVVEQHRSILLDVNYGLRALLDAWSASVKSSELALAPQTSSAPVEGALTVPLPQPAALPSFTVTASRGSLNASPNPPSASHHPLSKAASEFVEAPIKVGMHSADQHFLSSFPHPRPTRSMSFELASHQSSSQFPLSTGWGDDTAQQRESSWRWERASGASVVISSATAAASAAFSALSRGSSERFAERVGVWMGGGSGGGAGTSSSMSNNASGSCSLSISGGGAASAEAGRLSTSGVDGAVSSVGDLVRTDSDAAAHPPPQRQQLGILTPVPSSAQSSSSRSHAQAPLSVSDGPYAQDGGAFADVVSPVPAPAVEALKALYSLFSDVTEDECFVLMAAVLITSLIREAADLVAVYVHKLSSGAPDDPGSPNSPNGPLSATSSTTISAAPSGGLPPSAATGAAAAAVNVTHAGVALMSGIADLIDRYTDLVETVFHSQPILLQALDDGVEEIMCPSRWTKTGSLHAAQQRAQEMLFASAAAAAAGASPASPHEDSPPAPKSDLPSVLLSRDARHATAPLVALAAQHPHAIQQLKLSVLLARYADTFLQQERIGGRVVSGGIFKRLRLISRLVALVEDKDTFLEHYRLCLARRLLGSSGSAGGEASPTRASQQQQPTLSAHGTAQQPTGSVLLNIEAERQLVSCLQSYLGATGTHAFEAMLRDYEGTQRTRDAFEQEAAYAALAAKIRVQLITSAQWPMYAILPLKPHLSLQVGMDAFRGYYSRIHPSRSLLWVFSLGTATLTAEVVSGTKQIVASTLLATLLLVVSDAYNAPEGNGGGSNSSNGAITGAQIAQKVGMPFHLLRTHLHLLSQHRAFNLLRWQPASAVQNSSSSSHSATRGDSGGGACPTNVAASAMSELDVFTLNPSYTHKLRKIRLPLPKTRLTGLPSSEVTAEHAMSAPSDSPNGSATRRNAATSAAGTAPSSASGVASAMTATESEEAVVSRHVNASRRLLLDTALVRVFKSRRVVQFEELFQAVTAQLSRQFVPSRRDVKAQLEGLIDRDYVTRSAEDPNAFVYVS